MKKKYSVSKIQRHGFVFIIPTLIFFSIFMIYPMLSAFQLSCFKWNLVAKKEFVGLMNFIKLISDERFINSFLVTIHFTICSVISITILAFCLALILTSRLIRFKNILQSLIFLPVVLSMVAIAIVWKFMFQTTGLLSVISLKIFNLNIPWLTSSNMAPYSILLVNVWKYSGYYMVIFIAGLLDIPNMYYEAAKIDGAGFWDQLTHITIPSLKNTLILVFLSCAIFSFGTFSLQFVITEGGPSQSTEVLSLLIYRTAFHYTKFGYSSAISVIYFVTLLIFTVIQLKVFKSENL